MDVPIEGQPIRETNSNDFVPRNFHRKSAVSYGQGCSTPIRNDRWLLAKQKSRVILGPSPSTDSRALPVVDRRFQEQEQEQEQEKEEVVMDDDPEEYVQMKYSRDDEVPKGWAIRDLSRPVASQLGFYPASDFGVLTKLIQQVTRDSCFVGFSLWSFGVGVLSCCSLVLRSLVTERPHCSTHV